MLYNIHYNVSACVVYLFIISMIIVRKGFSKLSNRLFFALVISGLLSSILDIISAYYISYPETTSRFVLDFWNYAFLLIHNLMSPLFLMYVVSLSDLHRRLKFWQWVAGLVPIACSVGALLVNPLTHAVFYYDEGSIYRHGSQFLVLYVVAFLYMVASVAVVVFFRKAIPLRKVVSVIVCVAFCFVPILIQMFTEYLLIENFFQSIGIMWMLFTLENDDEVTTRITGVYNRYAFLQDVERAIYTGIPLLILSVKIYNVNYSHSTFGVQFMNGVLKRMAEWLDYLVKGADCYDCTDGHFALVMYGDDREKMLDAAEQIRLRFDEEWVYQALSVAFPAQICLLEVPKEVSSIEQIMLMLDVPADENNGRSQIIPSNALHSYQREVVIEQKIQEALERKLFQVYYQPIVDTVTGKVTSAEALLRLRDEELGFIPPDEFIPIAERNGSILELGAFVISESCRFYAENRLDLLGIRYIEVNLSVVQCMNHRLPQTIQNILDGYHLPPQRINLEITESAAAGNKTALEETVRALNDLGFPISLDDYGTGYSNYSYMFSLPFSIVKVDKSILWNAMDNNNHPGADSAMILLENTIRMLRQMRYHVVVEGVETEAQRRLLAEIGCDYLQGFLFSRPLPGNQFIDFVRTFNAA